MSTDSRLPAKAHPPAGKEIEFVDRPWLVMLYMAGDNDLSEDMVLALQTLQAEGPPKGDRIVAQFDPSGVGLSAQRYDFSEAKSKKSLEECLVKDKDNGAFEPNMGSPRVLLDFVQWARRKYEKEESFNRQATAM